MVENKLFKWIGGKKWLSNDLNSIFKESLQNNSIDTYIEPFAGGLGSFLYTIDTLKDNGIKTVILNDLNSNLINLYQNIQKNPKQVFKLYWSIEEKYQKTINEKALLLHHHKDKESLKPLLLNARSYFDEVKDKYNNSHTGIEKSVMFLFLVKHCFNGVYRENSLGHFNTGFNWKQNIFVPEKVEQTINIHSKIFNEFNISFHNEDVFKIIEKTKSNSSNSLFYFDPPYLNENQKENKYNKDHFNKEDQLKLLELYKSIDNVIFSNHYLELFEEFCNKEGFQYQEILRNNCMNPNSTANNSKISEILAFKTSQKTL